MKKPELLAPAGSMDALKAAVAAGCDAVYLGMTNFSARAFAGNFTREELKEAVRYAHIRNVRIYVTMNTMLYETEIENAIADVDFLYHADVDALLIQDFGLFHYVRTSYPDFDVHCSTQMHIHNLAGVRFMKQMGAARVVMARETPIELIEEAVKTGMEIEVFAYGAICISYSGQCLMSASLKNRSANRGMCAQCCRLKYRDENGQMFTEGEYVLSPKDLNVIDRLPQLMQAGVSSLKIEGRMKRPEYVYLAVRTFREAIDAFAKGREYKVSKKRQKELLLMFNRGFSHGHLFHDDVQKRMSWYRPNHMGVEIGSVLRYAKGRVEVKLSDSLNQNDGLRIIHEGEDIGLTAVKIEKNGRLVNHADAGDTVWLECHDKNRPKPGEKLRKTSDKKLLEETGLAIDAGRSAELNMHYEAYAGRPLLISAKDDRGNIAEARSDFVIQEARNAALSKDRIVSSLSRSGDFPYTFEEIEGEAGNIFMPISAINDTRRKALEAMNEMRAVLHPERTEKKPYAFTLEKPQEPQNHILLLNNEEYKGSFTYPDTEVICMEDPVQPLQNEVKTLTHHVISQAGDFAMNLESCIAGMNLNIANSYAAAFALSQKGVQAVIVSSEMNNDQIRMLIEAFEKRYGFAPFIYRLVYGKRTLMYIKDRFLPDENVNTISDLHGKFFNVTYNGGKAEIHEHEPYAAQNPYASGSVIILDEQPEKYKEIVEEAYEEFHERIQAVRA